MVKKYALILFLLTSISGRISFAQESMMTDVSYVFLEKLIATAKENYPRMNGFEGRINSAKISISQEQISWMDAFSFSYVYNPNSTLVYNPNTGMNVTPNLFNGYQIAVGFNLSAIFTKPGNVKQARESLKLAEYDLAEYNLTLETEVKRRYFAYVQALNLLKLQTTIASDASNISRDVKFKYEKSEVTFEQFTQSQIAFSSAIQSKIGAETNFLMAKASLEELLTKKIEEVN